MKELDSFTVERLGEIKNAFLDCHKETAPSIGEIFALIDIALAAKRAEFEKATANQVQKRLIGWRMEDYSNETTDKEVARNWASAVGVLPIFEGDINTNIEVKS
ncbi:TPA: hypothetical protein U5E37_003738 [Yersinia enterocolitica]|nr:hypothetical protein [Yersinia enterocolitica]